MQVFGNVLDLIGNTPLLRLSRSLATPDGPSFDDSSDAPGAGPLVLAKVEYLNPGGSSPGYGADTEPLVTSEIELNPLRFNSPITAITRP